MATAVDLLDLFPSASTSGARTVCVSAASLAVLGPQLPASCVLHLALNHLKHSGGGSDDGGDELHGSPGLSERARGKLPERSGFEEKVAGSDSDGEASDDRHSARTHFSWTPRHGGATEAALRRVLVLTPSRNTLRRQLADQFDDSLAGGRLDPIDLALLDRIDLRYLPTSAHLSYFLATAHLADTHTAVEAQAAISAPLQEDPSLIRHAPTLVILHDPSAYSDEPAVAEAGVSAYAAQIAHFFSTFRAISSSPPLLAVLDSADPHASKPILPRHLRRRSRPGPGAGDARATALQPRDQLELRTVLERFCDWVGSVEAIPGGIGQDEALDAPVRYLLAGHTTKPTSGAATERERSGLEFRIDPWDPRSGRGRQIEVVS